MLGCDALSIRERVRFDDAKTMAVQRRRQEPSHRCFIFDEQDGVRSSRHDALASSGASPISGGTPWSGNQTRNTAPPPSRSDASIRPPCAVAIARQTAKPSPTPAAFVLG